MGRILKNNNYNFSDAKAVFINYSEEPEESEKEKEEAKAQAEVQVANEFVDKIFQTLTPNDPDDQAKESNEEEHIGLSTESKEARVFAAIEALKRKELEIEAAKEDLKRWEATLQQREKELTAKEQSASEEIITRRRNAESEADNIVRMAKEASESTIAAAKSEADAIRSAAQSETEIIKERAHKEGYENGYAEGETRGLEEGEESAEKEVEFDWNNLMKESETLINELQMSRMGILKSSEEEMLRLVFAFAKTVIKTEPVAQPEIVLNNLEAAVNKIADVDKIVLRVNMKDKSMCQDHKDRFLSKLSSVTELNIVEDSNLWPGGIKIETGVGLIDASLEAQVKALEKALLEKYVKTSEQS